MTLATTPPPATITDPPLDQWLPATWDEFLAIAHDPAAPPDRRSYYYNGRMRFEMTPLGHDHARQNLPPTDIVAFYALVRQMRVVRYLNVSLRKTGAQECQPDLSVYVGDRPEWPPKGNEPIDLDRFGPPDLVVEVGASSFNDDLGPKRLLYEQLGVREYWVINANERQVIAFAIADRGSRAIEESQVLPGLSMAIVAEALERTDRNDDADTIRWLMEQFQAIGS
ncbi:Uma2 family endonuclease [Limnothrix sp. FACHB-1083]|uniref:Uma2 family endonuclease n=1 Tax=unclassified Limnothrix TaxID=2632864 RepID=UPI001680D179|nr:MULTISPECIES: Uma2 family endonuclease [unclassified Limnothrix]MBD2159791.1 Uma2 family endonuclease [Limnothrix sp. FACHB-1083]MBD2190493.1 Uma2 family endonuclease [Limnothrix sp. FACHB-1088]